MKKSLKCVLAILSIIALLLPFSYSYAIDEDEEELFFEISELEVTENGIIEMTINLEQIEYDKSVFVLESDEEIEDVELDEETESEEIEIEKSNNEITIEIDKETTNLSTITLYYQVSEEKQVGDIIKFTATITNLEDEEETESIEVCVEVVEEDDDLEKDDSEENQNTEKEEQNNESEKQNDENQEQDNENQEQSNNSQEQSSNAEKQQETTNNASQETTKTQATVENQTSSETTKTVQQTSSTIQTGTTTSNEKTVTYNGSDNNYLSELSIENYSLNKEFSKENSTYFVAVDSVDSLNITANVENDGATVCIYGNEELQEGTNKILISVTAENGNVRNYRIYVTKNA